MTSARLCLIAMGVGLALIVQPFVHALFAVGFIVALGAIVAYNIVSWLGKGGAE